MRPYVLQGMMCEICERNYGLYLCPEISCLFYFCVDCWIRTHRKSGMDIHQPVSKKASQFLQRMRRNPTTLGRYAANSAVGALSSAVL
uniref:CEBP_ZZ domain-containing protein n=1 Tax=Elaeophora elaphi TaxID=1147741 RepID=A0A0R3RMW4_9BILA